VSPCLGGFEGFDLTNTRDQLGGERSIGIFLGVIGHFWQQGRIVEGLQLSSGAWHLPAWGFSILTTQIYCIQSSLYIQPLEACWSLLLEHFVAALLSIFLAI
jgi:hypothetical protein